MTKSFSLGRASKPKVGISTLTDDSPQHVPAPPQIRAFEPADMDDVPQPSEFLRTGSSGKLLSKIKGVGSPTLAVLAMLHCGTAMAQANTAAQAQDAPAQQAGAGESGQEGDIVVTGSRISRAGYDQPTPTTVIGDTEIREGARANLSQILNDQPQFKPTTTPATSTGVTTGSGAAPVDLRGLGQDRTLVLLNGRRFVGQNNLNFIPIGLVDRLEVVTGGASAAWGSGAVAGVVNILLKDDLKGLTLGAQTGVSSRGDGQRYGFDASFGSHFADDRGRLIIGAEYLEDHGIPDRDSRTNLNSPGIITISPGVQRLVEDVNYTDRSHAGVITTGVLRGQTFNQDGSLRPFRGPDAFGVGGADAVNLYDDIYAATPFTRLNIYGRASYDLGGPTVWIDGSYGRTASRYPFFPDIGIAPLTVSATNPFLSAAIRSRLAAAGETSFTYGRLFDDAFDITFDSVRESKEGAIGLDGKFGNGWKYQAHFSHGEIDQNAQLQNSSIRTNLANALNAVTNSGGQIVCAINADATAANDDPACAPLNPFGEYNASAAALAYTRGTQQSFTTTKLDSAGVSLQGDLLNLWAGPLTFAVGGEARWEEQSQHRGALSQANVFSVPVYTSDLNGGFNVKEGFAELALPVLATERLKLDVNGAARYSDYSNSGGIWSWKLGGTARLFDDLLLRLTRSRDIRSPNVQELFAVQQLRIGPLIDQDRAGRSNPLYNPTPAQVTTYLGGNPDLVPEIGSTLTVGGSFSPSFFKGFSVSVDYYRIKIDGAIITLSASSLTQACANGSTAACDSITRDSTGTVTTVFANAQNIASFVTSGLDFEASYLLPLARVTSGMDGTIRFRALATYIDKLVQDTGVSRVDTAGDVGDPVDFGIPHWRGTFSLNYQSDRIGLDARARYVGGGSFNHLLTTLENNRVSSRTYVDLGAQVKLDRFTLFGNANNVFDVKPPLIRTGSAHYDVVGTYFTVGARVIF